MTLIEPDLVSTSIGTLDAKYKGETAEEKKDRLATYEKAFVIFESVLDDLDERTLEDLRAVKHKMRRRENKERASDTAVAAQLLDDFPQEE